MRLRSIPPRTHSTLARERKLISVARDYQRNDYQHLTPVYGGRGGAIDTSKESSIERGRMRPQISRCPFERKLMQLRSDLEDLTLWEYDFDVSKLRDELENQIERLLQLLCGEI